MNEKKVRAAVAADSNRPKIGLPKTRNSFPRPGKDSMLICTLGGVGQIGMNWTLYGHDGRWILVDAGSAFPPRDVDGVEAIMPDIEMLRPILPDLSGLIVTHAHEDHIGAIHRLWPTINCPIYATPFAGEVISHRLWEAGTREQVRMKRFLPGGTFRVSGFTIKAVRTTHSVPECVGLAINTPVGTVFHSGDWKFDPHPLIGKPTDIGALQEIGRAGVLAMVCDSTNADRSGAETTERDVAVAMERVLRRTSGMVVVSCFSTNIARIASIATAANRTGRVAALAGRSLVNNEHAARKVGLLDGVPNFLASARHLRGLDKKEMVLVCTGSQGEGNAALARLAFDPGHALPQLGPGDAVVHSARVIPGNEEGLYAVLDAFRARGVDVLQGSFAGKPLHVTGHAVAEEIDRMYGYIKPRFAIPVHGESRHLELHAGIARRAGVADVAVGQEGAVWSVNAMGIELAASVPMRLVAELSGGQRGIFVPWNPADPASCLDHVPTRSLMVA